MNRLIIKHDRTYRLPSWAKARICGRRQLARLKPNPFKTGLRNILFAVAVTVIAAGASGQSSPTIYAESFRKHATRITEESFEAKLSPDNPTYRERIKDSAGNDRYELTITPQGPEGDNKITSWRVVLRDLKLTIYPNLLVADQQPSMDAKNNLWWLNPNRFVAVPIRTRRIVKVDDFYVVMQVKDFHFTPLDSPYLDSMTVKFAFTNSDPRTNQMNRQ